MPQVYHSNARTNQHVREIIQNSDLTNVKLADKYNRLLLKPQKKMERNLLLNKYGKNKEILQSKKPK